MQADDDVAGDDEVEDGGMPGADRYGWVRPVRLGAEGSR